MHIATSNKAIFSLRDSRAYRQWREQKLTAPAEAATIPIDAASGLSHPEQQNLLSGIRQRNFAIFRLCRPTRQPEQQLQILGQQLGLNRLDTNLCAGDSGLSAITANNAATGNTYIPYTNRPLGWHTDGYYNAEEQNIRAWLLYCVHPAAVGGVNSLMDHEIAYIRLRDQNPQWIRALMARDAFTIPGNSEGGAEIRPARSGPVFSCLPGSGALHMRYSARQRNIIWKDDRDTQDATKFLRDLLSSDDDRILHYRLAAGEGIISNNALHRRTGFTDSTNPDDKRLIYRARYYDRLDENQIRE